MKRCRLITDQPRPGAWNMAADEFLLQCVAESKASVLRLYEWSEPTLSLGYFQQHEKRSQHAASVDCPIIRRSSGGGAILHDRELTYCFVAPIEERRFREHDKLYACFHDSIIEVLQTFGVQNLRSADGTSGLKDAFLCFQRHSVGDILIGTNKVVGSAQRRSKMAILQHGSILWRQSSHAPELDGINDLSMTEISPRGFSSDWLMNLKNRLVVEFDEECFNQGELAAISHLNDDKFGNARWTKRR